MRMFWKLFLALLATLLLTVFISSWVSRIWLQENRVIDARISMLATMGETAVSIYELEGESAYHRWLRHSRHKNRYFGLLLDKNGQRIGNFGRRMRGSPIAVHFKRLLQRVVAEKRQISEIKPPGLAVALPLSGQNSRYYWVAGTMLSPEEMQQTGGSMRFMRPLIALLTVALVGWLLTGMLIRPIRSLQRTTEQLGNGNLKARVEHAVSIRNDELGELGRSVDAMAAQLDSLIASHKQLLRDISHELRSPLARLQVALELARNETSGAADPELDRIEKETERLNELIGEVLTLARFEQGAVETRMELLQADELIRRIADDAAFEAEAAGKSVRCIDLPVCSIMADRLWLGRALDNVIRNAIRHTPSGSSVEVSVQSDETQVALMIRDHGPGVDASLLPQLFEPFFRASDARERHADTSGYGLGLAIARRAVELHHGRITATNHQKGGLQVEIILPLST